MSDSKLQQMNPNYEMELQQLRQKLGNKDLSILVGAGFSKNVHSELFLSWWELLEKMVRRMNIKNYASAYERLTGKKPKDSDKEYQNYIQDQVTQYLEQTDYLQVVSSYIKKMGYRETVDACIEESIPQAVIKDGRTILVSKENGTLKETEIKSSDLDIHRKLITLPWNNIYTTNYDNLLEVCINDGTIAGLESQVRDYETEIVQLKESIQVNTKKADELFALIQTEDMAATNPDTPLGLDDLENDVAPQKQFTDKVKKLYNKKASINYQIIHAEYQITDLTKRKLKLEEALVDSYVVVKHSSQLAIKRNRNIIKLHGSLPIDEDDLFAFDNEYDKRYIISQEDYEHYPMRHEAFTQLMRISLLQGYFCLIGFSGDDPNFMAWISWVRSIIMRNASKEFQETKIYFLDARASSAPDPHKAQFYKNHRISYIPLCHPACITFLNTELERNIGTDDTKTLLNTLMDYLADISMPNRSQISYEIMARERYSQLWGKMENRRTLIMDNQSIANTCRHYRDLHSLKRYNLIPQFADLANDQKRRLLSNSNAFWTINEIDAQTEWELLGLIALALEDLFIPYSIVVEEAEFRRLFARAKTLSPDIHRRYMMLDLKDAIWTANPGRSKKLWKQLKKASPDNCLDDAVHLLLVDAAVNLRFSELNNILEQYPEQVQATATLAGYWFYFDPGKGIKLIKGLRPELAQEQAYSLGILRFLDAEDDSSKVYEKCQRLKHEGLCLLEDNQKYAISQLRGKTKFDPFENDSILSRSFSIDNSGRSLLGFQTIGMMLEVGLPLSGNGYYFQDKHDMHPIFLQVFERFPQPVLFYALQYGDKKYIKRVAQDFMFNENIFSKSDHIFEVMSSAYDDPNTPSNYKANILTFLSEFIYIVIPRRWHPFLLSVWNEKLQKNTLFSNDAIRDVEFIESGLRFCQDPEILSTAIIDCLKAATKSEDKINSANRYLYRLANNPFLKSFKIGIQKKINGKLVARAIELVGDQPDYLFVLGNLHIFLTPTQIRRLEKKLLEVKYANFDFPNLWSIAVHYGEQDKATQRKIVDELLKSPMLWKTGISIEGKVRISYSDTNGYVPIRKLRKGKGSKGLKFNRADAVKIYEKMKPRLEEIKKVRRRDHLWNDSFFALLQEMHWFLEAEATQLQAASDYLEIKDTVIRLAFDGNKDLHILSGLTADDSSLTNQAVTEIAVALYDREEFEEQNREMQLMINKVLLKQGSGIVLCLEYLVSLSKYFKKTEQFKAYAADLSRILIVYKEGYPLGLQIPRLEELLVELALILDYWGHTNEATKHFLDKLNSSRFNNIRYNLKEKLKQRKVV